MGWQYFKLEEFECHCGCGANLIQPNFVDKLDGLRRECGFALPVRSGYRCPTHNARVSKTGETGPHTTGRAVDIGVHGRDAYVLLCYAVRRAEFTGIGIKQSGDMTRRFIHLDDLQGEDRFRPTVWSY